MHTGLDFSILDSVESTNNYAMQQVHAGMAKHGMAWFAREQTAGKGQMGKSWQSEPGQNIAMSIVLKPEMFKNAGQIQLIFEMAMACRSFMEIHSKQKIKIKWPNDIYWNDRKAGGILIESIMGTGETDHWKWAVVGVGMNINQTVFDPLLPNPVSLKQITGKEYDPIELAKELGNHLLNGVDQLCYKTKDRLLIEYQQHLFRLNEKVKLRKDNAVFETVIKGVNLKGQLMVEDVMERVFDFGEVEWIL